MVMVWNRVMVGCGRLLLKMIFKFEVVILVLRKFLFLMVLSVIVVIFLIFLVRVIRWLL